MPPKPALLPPLHRHHRATSRSCCSNRLTILLGARAGNDDDDQRRPVRHSRRAGDTAAGWPAARAARCNNAPSRSSPAPCSQNELVRPQPLEIRNAQGRAQDGQEGFALRGRGLQRGQDRRSKRRSMASRTQSFPSSSNQDWQYIDAFAPPQSGAQIHQHAVDDFEAGEIGPFFAGWFR